VRGGEGFSAAENEHKATLMMRASGTVTDLHNIMGDKKRVD
jgi:hypothetical protein